MSITSNTGLRALALGLALAAGAVAQRTWIVDSTGGPGVDFTDLPPAVQAANPGDTILVRPGNGTDYSGPTVTKGLRIVGEASFAVPLRGHTLIENVPIGQTCTLSNFFVGHTGNGARLTCRNSAGTVVLERVEDPLDFAGQLFLLDCDRVVIHASRFWNAGISLRFERSRVILVNSEFGGVQGQITGEAAIRIDEGQLTIVDTFIRGADGWEAWCDGPRVLGTPAVCSRVSLVLVQGRSRLEGGRLNGCTPHQQAALNHADPRSVTIIDPMGAHLGSFPVSTIRREMSAVSAGPIDAQRTVTVTTYGPRRSNAALFASVVTGFPPIGISIGEFWLDPNLSVHVFTGPLWLFQNRALPVAVTLPASLPLGLPLLWQSALLTPAATVELSTPDVTVVL